MYEFLQYKVDQFMTGKVKTLTPDTTLRNLEVLIEQYDYNGFPVLDRGKLIGFMTKFDFLKAFAFSTRQMIPSYSDIMYRSVGEFMTEAVIHVSPEDPLSRVLQLMVQLKTRSFPVMDKNGQLAGIIAREDLMQGLQQSTSSNEVAET